MASSSKQSPLQQQQERQAHLRQLVEHSAWLITPPFSLQSNQTYVPSWEHTFTLPFAFEHCQRDNVLMLFEIVELIRDSIYYRVCWGFLQTAPTATHIVKSSSPPLLRLQLYRYKPPPRFSALFTSIPPTNVTRKQLRNLWGDFEADSSLEVPHVYHVWSNTNRLTTAPPTNPSMLDENKRRTKYPATLYITMMGSQQLFASSMASPLSSTSHKQPRPSTPNAGTRRLGPSHSLDNQHPQLLTVTKKMHKIDAGPRYLLHTALHKMTTKMTYYYFAFQNIFNND